MSGDSKSRVTGHSRMTCRFLNVQAESACATVEEPAPLGEKRETSLFRLHQAK